MMAISECPKVIPPIRVSAEMIEMERYSKKIGEPMASFLYDGINQESKPIIDFGIGYSKYYFRNDLVEKRQEWESKRKEIKLYKVMFGKYSGKTLEEIVKIDSNYLTWLANDQGILVELIR